VSMKKILFAFVIVLMTFNIALAQNRGNGRGNGNGNQGGGGFLCNGNFFSGFVNVSVSNMNFGNYNPAIPSPLDSTFGVTLSCVNGFFSNFATLPPVSISLSTGNSGNYGLRTMNGPSKLNYQIYTDSTFSTVWGNGTGGSQSVSAGYNGANSQTIYGQGQIQPKQFVKPGSYADTITVTVTY